MSDLTLRAKTAVDMKEWNSAFLSMFGDLDKFEAKQSRMKTSIPRMSSEGQGGAGVSQVGTDMAGTIGQLAAQIAPLGDKMAGSIQKGLNPINRFLPQFSQEFQALGTIAVNVAKRMDQQMRFPLFQKSISAIRSTIDKFTKDSTGKIKTFANVADTSLAIIGNVSKIQNFFASLKRLTKGGQSDLSKLKPPTFVTNNITHNISQIGSAAREAQQHVKGLFGQFALAVGATALVYKTVEALKSGVTGAMNLGETVSKVDTIFGNLSGSVKGNADKMAKDFGLPKQAILDSAAAFGLVGKAAGYNGQQTAALANDMGNLAADVSSFYNIPLDDALNKLRSGLVGEAEPMRSLGVLLNEGAVKAEAFRLGLSKAGGDLSEQAKVQARASLITKGLADAQGDLAKTQGSTSNQARKFSGTMDNLVTTIGEALLPVMDKGLILLNSFGEMLVESFDGSKSTVQSWGETFLTWVDKAIMFAFNFGDYWAIAGLIVTETVANMMTKFDAFGQNIPILGQYAASNFFNFFRDAAVGIWTVYSNLMDNLGALFKSIWNKIMHPEADFKVDFKPLLDGFESSMTEMPKLVEPAYVNMADDMGKHFDKIAEREGKKDELLSKFTPKADGAAGVKRGVVDTSPGSESLSEQRMKELTTFANQFKDKTATPIEKFQESMQKAQEAFKAGLLTEDQFKKADQFAMKEAGLNTTPQSSGAMDFGSKEAYSTILAATTGKVDGFKNMERIGNQQLTALNKIADGVNKVAVKPGIQQVGVGI